MRTNLSSAIHLSSHFSWLVLLPCAVIAVLMLVKPSYVWAQDSGQKYSELKFDDKLKRDLNIPRILRGDDGWKIADHRPYVEQYLNTYIFAEMTLANSKENLPELRQAFFKKIWQAKDPEALKAVNEITLKTMMDFINPRNNYHPAVQYNAVLILGDLESSPRLLIGRQTKPTPWAGALDMLVRFTSPKATTIPDHIKVGALIGIRKHAEFGLSPDTRDSVTSAMSEIIEEKTPPPGRDRQVHDWMRRRACEVVGFAGQTGGTNKVPNMLIATMNDPQATLALRCSAAHALGKLKYEGALGIKTDTLAAGMGDLALAVCNDTKARTKTTEDRRVANLIASQAAVRFSEIKTGFVAPITIGAEADVSLARDVNTQVELLLNELGKGSVSQESLNGASQQIAVRLGKTTAPAAKQETTTESPDTTKTPAKEAVPPADDPFGGAPPF